MAGPKSLGRGCAELITCSGALGAKFTRCQHKTTALFTLTRCGHPRWCIERAAIVGHRCAVNDADREPSDAPPPRSRRAILLLLLGLVVAGGATVALTSRDRPTVRVSVTPIEPVIEPPAPVEVAPPPLAPVPPLPAPRPLAQAPVRQVRPAPGARAIPTTIVIAETVGGDAVVRKALVRAFGRGLKGLDLRAQADTGYSVTIHVDEQQQRGEEVTVRCALSVALLPKQHILASLKARADVAGADTPVDELYGDAAEACGQAIAKDLTTWVKAHPLGVP